MSIFVLVHGAWHGGWCWNKVVPLLEEYGHKVEAFDLPGHGKDSTPASEVTLQSYVDKVIEVIDSQPEPVILVGHSAGGLSITQTAEFRPNKIKKLVYLTADLFWGDHSNQPSDFGLGGYFSVEHDDGTITVKEEGIKKLFYNRCSDEDVIYAKSLLVPQAIATLSAPMQLTEGNFGRVPRVYIECLRDNAILPSVQKEMYSALPCELVISMDTDHSPFFSAPQELAKNLDSIASLASLASLSESIR